MCKSPSSVSHHKSPLLGDPGAFWDVETFAPLEDPVSLFVNVIFSPDLAIVRPVPASSITSSVPPPESVNLIFSSSQ